MPNEKEKKIRRNKSNAQWALLSIQNKCRQWVRQTKYYFHQIRILGLIPLHFANFIRAHFGIRKECLNIKNLFGVVFFLYSKECKLMTDKLWTKFECTMWCVRILTKKFLYLSRTSKQIFFALSCWNRVIMCICCAIFFFQMKDMNVCVCVCGELIYEIRSILLVGWTTKQQLGQHTNYSFHTECYQFAAIALNQSSVHRIARGDTYARFIGMKLQENFQAFISLCTWQQLCFLCTLIYPYRYVSK